KGGVAYGEDLDAIYFNMVDKANSLAARKETK
ncbi:hypothetical protein LCGC14_2274510, partial [marine sediment metagenome]